MQLLACQLHAPALEARSAWELQGPVGALAHLQAHRNERVKLSSLTAPDSLPQV